MFIATRLLHYPRKEQAAQLTMPSIAVFEGVRPRPVRRVMREAKRAQGAAAHAWLPPSVLLVDLKVSTLSCFPSIGISVTRVRVTPRVGVGLFTFPIDQVVLISASDARSSGLLEEQIATYPVSNAISSVPSAA